MGCGDTAYMSLLCSGTSQAGCLPLLSGPELPTFSHGPPGRSPRLPQGGNNI